MASYGIFDMIFPLTLIAYILSGKIKYNLDYKIMLYYSGVIMLVTLLITLTRRTQIDIIWTVIHISRDYLIPVQDGENIRNVKACTSCYCSCINFIFYFSEIC